MTQNSKNDAYRTVLSLSFGLPIGLLISNSWTTILVVCVFAAATTALSGSSLAFWICPIISFSVITISLTAAQLLGGDSRFSSDLHLSGSVFKLLFLAAWGLSALGMRRYRHSFACKGETSALTILALVAGVVISRIQWDPIGGFRTITQFGEDNGAWLNNVALSLQNKAAWSPNVGVSGGALLASIITGAVSLIDRSSWHTSKFDSTGLILLRIYGWGLLMMVVLCVATFVRLCTSINRFSRYSVMLLAVLLSVVLGLNFLKGGYLTALLAAVWVSASTLTAVVLGTIHEKNRVVICLMLASLVLVAGEMWFPLFYWAIVVAVVSTLVPGRRGFTSSIKKIRQYRSKHRRDIWLMTLVLMALIAVVAILSTNPYVGSYMFNVSQIVSLIHTAGGPGPSRLEILILLAAVVAVLRANATAQMPLTVLILGTTFSIASVFMLALVTWPNTIGYGPSKFLQIMTISLIPLSCSALAQLVASIQRTNSASNNLMAVGALFIALIQFGLPLQNLEELWKPRSEPSWFKGVVAARTRFPDRVPLCLDTTKGGGRSERAYECSRLAIGLVGGERSSISEQLYTFQWGNICTIEPDEAHLLWDDNFFQRP